MGRANIKVSGRVQRVFFRVSTESKAKQLGLTGWVKNEKNGSVNILAEGAEEKIEKLINWLKRGPILAKVKDVDVQWINGESEFADFQIIR